jgi:hypothetical protein
MLWLQGHKGDLPEAPGHHEEVAAFNPSLVRPYTFVSRMSA